MGLTTRASISQLLTNELRQVVISVGKERPLEYEGIINVNNDVENPVIDQQMFGLGPMGEKPENNPFPLDTIFMGGRVQYNAKSYGMALEFSKEAWLDDKYAALKREVGEMATSWRHRKNVQGFAVLNDGFAGATYTGFDTLALFSTSHGTTEPDGATKANRPSPDVSFSVTGVQNMILSFEGMRTGRNMPRILTPAKLVLPPALRFTAREILGSLGKVDSADNNISGIIGDDLTWTIVHYFATSTMWVALTKPGDHDINLNLVNESEFDSFDDPYTGAAVFTMWGRISEGFGEWRGAYGSTG